VAIPFPDLIPTRRDFTLGKFPVKKFTALDGVSSTRLYGSKSFDSVLNLEFSGLTDAQVVEVNTAYKDAKGGFLSLDLPNNLWRNIEPDLKTALDAGYQWRFTDQPPQLVQQVLGRFTISLSLLGTRTL